MIAHLIKRLFTNHSVAAIVYDFFIRFRPFVYFLSVESGRFAIGDGRNRGKHFDCNTIT